MSRCAAVARPIHHSTHKRSAMPTTQTDGKPVLGRDLQSRARRQDAALRGETLGTVARTKRQPALPSRWCCAACRRDVDSLRRYPDNISDRIEVIAEVLHGCSPREPQAIQRRSGAWRDGKRGQTFFVSWGGWR